MQHPSTAVQYYCHMPGSTQCLVASPIDALYTPIKYQFCQKSSLQPCCSKHSKVSALHILARHSKSYTSLHQLLASGLSLGPCHCSALNGQPNADV